MKDFEKNSLTFKERSKLFNELFSTGYFTDIQEKFAIISIAGWLTNELRVKKPDVTYYNVLKLVTKGLGIDDIELEKWAIIIEDFSYGISDFPHFDLTLKEAPKKLKELFSHMMPF